MLSKTMKAGFFKYLLALSIVEIRVHAIIAKESKNACTTVPAYYTKELRNKCYYNPDVLSNVLDTVTRHGYKGQALETITDDGYILIVFQILPKKGSDTTDKPPIYIQHGIATNSGPWIDKDERSLAFVFADLGYEVYLGNIRGSTYSKGHKIYKSIDYKYWNYTLDTLAANDIPTQLKLVTQLTGKKVLYIGHSMGTTLYFMYASENPQEASSLIQGMIAFAPIVYFKSNVGIKLATPLVNLLDLVRLGKIFYNEDLIHRVAYVLCPHFPNVCRWIQFITLGKSNQFLPEDLLLYYTYWPSTVAIKQFVHYVQMYNSGKFQKYNYGKKTNEQIYSSDSPPLYDLSKITIPTYLFYGDNDALTDGNHVQKVYNELGSKTKSIQAVPKDNQTLAFSHFDFLYGAYLQEFLYNDVISIASSYTSEPASF